MVVVVMVRLDKVFIPVTTAAAAVTHGNFDLFQREQFSRFAIQRQVYSPVTPFA